MSRAPVRFDDSLPTLVQVVGNELGPDAFDDGVVVRDALGRLSFFSFKDIDDTSRVALAKALTEALAGYARPDRVLATPKDPGAGSILNSTDALPCRVGDVRLRLIDRRFVGADWLRRPAPAADDTPRFVFASIKGGVGRSTALVVTAAHLATRGDRVLVIDFDLEAPGLGTALLQQGTEPEFGLVDAFIESQEHLAPLDARFYADLVGTAALGDRKGRVDVVPAFGRRSITNPGDVLAKIARAYLETNDRDGRPMTLLDQTRKLVDHFAESGRYDAILLDARAGLHESTASAVLGLGAEVLLFGLDEAQSFLGYRVLFAHLARFMDTDVSPEWVERLTMVQAKAPVSAEERQDFARRCEDLFRECGLLPAEVPASREPLPAGDFDDVIWDESLPDEEILPAELLPDGWSMNEPAAVLYSANYHHFDPLARPDLVSTAVYRSVFGDLLDKIEQVIDAQREGMP